MRHSSPHGFRSAASLVGLIAVACLIAGAAHAGVGVVANVSGPLSVKKTDGAVRALAVNSAVDSGDTLFTEKDTFARVKFADGGEVTLRPNSQFQVENFRFAENQAKEDNAVFRLVKGGLRAITGLIGKRNQEKYSMTAPTATIGIRGTHFGVLFCQNDCGGITTADGKTPEDGLHVDVADGAIIVTNQGGQQLFGAGQSGFVQTPTTPPVIVPENKAVKVEVRLQATPGGGSEPCVVQ
jgi:hypothetical protein